MLQHPRWKPAMGGGEAPLRTWCGGAPAADEFLIFESDRALMKLLSAMDKCLSGSEVTPRPPPPLQAVRPPATRFTSPPPPGAASYLLPSGPSPCGAVVIAAADSAPGLGQCAAPDRRAWHAC